MKKMYVYILASETRGTLYIGLTNNLVRRVYEHKEKLFSGFSSRYDINKLVYYEIFEDEENAIIREKNIKKWYRDWKIALIEKTNPEWVDLYSDIL